MNRVSSPSPTAPKTHSWVYVVALLVTVLSQRPIYEATSITGLLGFVVLFWTVAVFIRRTLRKEEICFYRLYFLFSLPLLTSLTSLALQFAAINDLEAILLQRMIFGCALTAIASLIGFLAAIIILDFRKQ